MPRIINLKMKECPRLTGEYVGRGNYAYHYGNPFTHLPLSQTKASVRVGSVEEAVAAFRDWLEKKAYLDVEPARRDWILANLKPLKDQNLCCWCIDQEGWDGPPRCHAQVLMRIANAG